MEKRFGFCCLLLAVGILSVYAQEPVGIFDDSVDIGEPGYEGFVAQDGDYYQADASGAGIDDFADSCFFVYKELTGNFSIEGIAYPLGGGEGGFMIRQDLEPGSPFAAYVRHSDESVYPLFRTLREGAMTDDSFVAIDALYDGSVRLVRAGNSIHFYTLDINGEWALQQTEIIELKDPVYVGLVATAGNNDNLESFDYEFVQIEEFPFSVTRDFGTDEPLPGDSLTVVLTAKSSDIVSATVSEIVPSGATISSTVADGGDVVVSEDGDIEWALADLSGEATLSYTIQLPNQSTVIWNGTFTDGERNGYIGGDLYVADSVDFQPRESFAVHPIIPRFIEAEWGTLVGAERTVGLHFDPRSENGLVVSAARGSASAIVDGVLEYSLDVQEAGTYYFFAQCRRENDQSDSIFVGFDEIDVTDEYAYPMSGGKSLTRRWWYTFEEGGRFWNTTSELRPIELTAGRHTLYIAPRETNASIDWFVVTSDPNFAISAFEPRESFFTAARGMPDTGETLPASIPVTLDAGVVKGSGIDLRVEERFPEGWTVSDLNANDGSAEIIGNTIVWTAPGLDADSQMTYTATPAAGAVLGIFGGTATDRASGEVQPIAGKFTVPDIIPFQIRTQPIDVSPTEVAFIQAEAAHAVSGDYVVQADDSLVSLLYAMPTSSGRSGGIMADQELTFELNVQEAGTYYVFANTRSENDQTDSFYFGFDVDFDGLSDAAESDPYAFAVPTRGAFSRTWNRLYQEGQRFWVVTDEPRPHELTAGSHTLSWHSREPEAKVDWIAVTTDPTLDLTTILEPGEVPDTAVKNFMLY